jgi:hypothetical protein
MSERICSNCKSPIAGHVGTSGRHCDWAYKDSDSGSVDSLADLRRNQRIRTFYQKLTN